MSTHADDRFRLRNWLGRVRDHLNDALDGPSDTRSAIKDALDDLSRAEAALPEGDVLICRVCEPESVGICLDCFERGMGDGTYTPPAES